MSCIGYEDDDELLLYYKIPLKSLDVGLKPLVSDGDISNNFVGYVNNHKIMDVYVELVEKTESSSDELKVLVMRMEKGDSESEDANDFLDEEHLVDEVEVNMKDDLEVLDFDSLESDQEDVPENARSRGLRKLRKKRMSFGIRNNFYVGKEFANRDLAKDMIRAYIVEIRRNLDSKDQRGCILCKHGIAAIHDMADNGMDVGTPGDHPKKKEKQRGFKAIGSTDGGQMYDMPTEHVARELVGSETMSSQPLRTQPVASEPVSSQLLMEPPGSEASDARSKDKGNVPVIDLDSENVNQRVDEHIDERVSDQVDEQKKGRLKSFVWDHFPYKAGATETTCPYCSTVKDKKKQTKLSFKPATMGESGGTLVSHSFNQERCRKAVARMCIKDNQPFSIVEDEGFSELVWELNSEFKLPSRLELIDRDYASYFNNEIEDGEEGARMIHKTKKKKRMLRGSLMRMIGRM
nr:zinc finger, BED-type [Tanacetum cinerariifolium]